MQAFHFFNEPLQYGNCRDKKLQFLTRARIQFHLIIVITIMVAIITTNSMNGNSKFLLFSSFCVNCFMILLILRIKLNRFAGPEKAMASRENFRMPEKSLIKS